MRKFAFLLCATIALAGADASAKPKQPKGRPPVILDVQTALVAWRTPPKPAPSPGYWYVCSESLRRCPLTPLTFRLEDPDSKAVQVAHRVLDGNGKIVYQISYNGWVGGGWIKPGGIRVGFFWGATWDYPAGLYQFQIRARDNKWNYSPWVTSAQVLYL